MANIDLTPILQALIGLLATLITVKLIPWIKSKLNESQENLLEIAITSAIFAAEQIYGSGHGAEKMDYALGWLMEQGFEVDRRRIEAAVYEALNQFKAQPPDEHGDIDSDREENDVH